MNATERFQLEQQYKSITDDYKNYSKEELAFALWCREIQLRMIRKHSFDRIIKDRDLLLQTIKKQLEKI